MSWDAWIGHNECHEEPSIEIEGTSTLTDPNTFEFSVIVRVKIKFSPEMQAEGPSYCRNYALHLIEEKLK